MIWGTYFGISWYNWLSWVALVVKNPPAKARDMRCGLDSWVGKIPWRRAWQPTPVFLPGEFHGQKNLVGYSSEYFRTNKDIISCWFKDLNAKSKTLNLFGTLRTEEYGRNGILRKPLKTSSSKRRYILLIEWKTSTWQNESNIRYHFIPIRITKFQRSSIGKCQHRYKEMRTLMCC